MSVFAKGERRRQRNRTKCEQCRKDHAKCLPEDRLLPMRCDRCVRYDKPCSANRLARQERPKNDGHETNFSPTEIDTSQSLNYADPIVNPLSSWVKSYNSATGNQDITNLTSRYDSEHTLMISGVAFTDESGCASVFRPQKRPSANFDDQQLEKKVRNDNSLDQILDSYQTALNCLNEVDHCFELYKGLQQPLALVTTSPIISYPDAFLPLVKEDTRKKLITLLLRAESFADDQSHPSDKRIIFVRLMDIWEVLNKETQDEPVYTSLLHKMEEIYTGTGEDIKLEEILKRLAKQKSKEGPEHDIHLKLARSYRKTSKAIDKMARNFKKQSMEPHLNLNSPLPPLQRAIQSNTIHAFNILLSENYDSSMTEPCLSFQPLVPEMEIRDIFNQTPLLIAASSDNGNFLSALLEKNANTDARDCNGHTTLETASRNGQLVYVRALISMGAQVNPIIGMFASPPLHAAVEGGNPEVVKYLLAHGADHTTLRCRDQRTALQLATKMDLSAVIRLLEEGNQGTKQFYDDEYMDQFSKASEFLFCW